MYILKITNVLPQQQDVTKIASKSDNFELFSPRPPGMEYDIAKFSTGIPGIF